MTLQRKSSQPQAVCYCVSNVLKKRHPKGEAVYRSLEMAIRSARASNAHGWLNGDFNEPWRVYELPLRSSWNDDVRSLELDDAPPMPEDSAGELRRATNFGPQVWSSDAAYSVEDVCTWCRLNQVQLEYGPYSDRGYVWTCNRWIALVGEELVGIGSTPYLAMKDLIKKEQCSRQKSAGCRAGKRSNGKK